jgi:hypothetical protein
MELLPSILLPFSSEPYGLRLRASNAFGGKDEKDDQTEHLSTQSDTTLLSGYHCSLICSYPVTTLMGRHYCRADSSQMSC